jgi:hypothetical protein
MARTDADMVGGVIELDPGIDPGPFILAANELVTEICQPLGYSDTRLTLIETWLAAHFYGVRDRETQIAQEWIGQALGTQYRGKVDLGLNFTPQGQQVMLLDTKMGLAQLQKSVQLGHGPVTLGMVWLGDPCLLPDRGLDLERLEEAGD